jgi:hypothetical protein
MNELYVARGCVVICRSNFLHLHERSKFLQKPKRRTLISFFISLLMSLPFLVNNNGRHLIQTFKCQMELILEDGCIFHPVDIMKGFGLEPADPPFDCRIEWKKFGLFIWSDGGRVDTHKVFSILRLIDCYHDLTERMFPTFASVRGIWFQLLGRESDLKHVSDLRVKHLRQMERQIWTMTKPDNSKIYIKVEVKFISGDNKLLWTEAGIGGKDYRCAHCTCRATHQHWMRYKPLDIRNSPLSPYSDRTLLYQGIAYIDSNDGVCRVPPLNQLSCRRSSAIIFTCAVMHNIRGVLRVFSFRCAFVGIVSTQPNS